LEQEKHELRLQLDGAVMSSCQAAADHRADVEDLQRDMDDLQRRLDDAVTCAAVQQRADRQMIDELTQENERLSEQLLTVSTSVCL